MSLRLASFLDLRPLASAALAPRALAKGAAFVLLASLLAGCTPQIGKSCSLSTDCSTLGDRLCDTTQPSGYCTVFNCEPDQCPSSICVAFDSQLDPSCGAAADGRWPRFERTFCMSTCNTNGDCREQYDCVDLSLAQNQTQRRAQVVDQYADDGGLGYKVCMASTCADGIQDGTETDVDCGGSACYACGNGLHCGSNSDCASGICAAGICLGSQICQTDLQCSSGLCNNADPVNGCPAATNCSCAGTNCNDKQQDGQETDVDCGGPDCARCVSFGDGGTPPAGATLCKAPSACLCAVAADCASNLCYQQGTTSPCPTTTSGGCTCSPGDCRDGKQDGAETDIDCGGGSTVNGVAIGCPGCLLHQACKVDTDCSSSNCVSNACAPPLICSAPDAGPAWTPYNPDAGAGGAGTGGAGTGGAGGAGGASIGDAGDGG